MEGVTIGAHEDKMGIRASSTTTVYFEDVKVPRENLLGPLNGGFKVAMSILNSGRSGLGGGCVGAMKHLIELASKRAQEPSRQPKAFGRAQRHHWMWAGTNTNVQRHPGAFQGHS